MKVIYPQKLQQGDKVMVVAPARSFHILSDETVQRAITRLNDLGLEVVFGKHIDECDEFSTSSVASRVEDLHTAFSDTSIKGIFSAIGGYSTNQLLDYLDYDLIRANPKIVCGFSDTTILHTALLAKTGLVGYYGPHFSSFGIKYGFEYSIEYFKKCCMESASFKILPYEQRSDDTWYLDQEKRVFEKSNGYVTLQEGTCKGRIIGGHIHCFTELFGTPYSPILDEDCILCIEQDEEYLPQMFEGRLQQILQTPYKTYIKGIVVGRFQKKNSPSLAQLHKIFSSKKELKNLPIVADVNFGHTMPIATFPLGGMGTLSIDNEHTQIHILEH